MSYYAYETQIKNLNELTIRIMNWAIDRNLHVADPSKQFLKLIEEVGELAEAMAKGRPEDAEDGLGDIYVVITTLAMQLDLDITKCIDQAYNEIKDRTGKMINGVFVKEEDLQKE